MKIRKLHEENELEKRAKQQKKHGTGLSPFCTLNKDAGNVEHNIMMFNKMSGSVEGPSNNPVSGPHGGDVGVTESLIESTDTIELHYDDLKVTVVARPAKAPSYHFEYDRDEEQTVEERVAHNYSVPKKEIVEFLMENITDEDLPEIDDVTDAKLKEFVNKNFDSLFDKYEVEILNNYREQAREDAERHMNESVNLTESVDYTTEQFLIELGQTQDEEIYKIYLRKEIDEDTASEIKKIRTAYIRYARVDNEEKMMKLVDKVRNLLTACSDKVFEEVESSNEYIVMAITSEGKKQYYNVSSVPHWVDKGADATIFDNMDEARAVWFKIDKKPFKRVMIPNYDHDLMNEALTPVDFDTMYRRDMLRDRISFMMEDSVGKYYQTIPSWQDNYKVNTKQGSKILEVQFDTQDPSAGFVFSIDGRNTHRTKSEQEAAKIIIDAAKRKYFKSFDIAVESVQENWMPPENWMSYKGAWIYPVSGGYEANFMGQHFEGATMKEIKSKLTNARIHMQRFSGQAEKASKFADNIKQFGREIEENWNPELTDCPACGDLSFDSRKGCCTQCSYRESLLNEESSNYEFVSSKSVMDSDGFYTDYTWYKSSDGLNVFVFGDNEVYTPEDGYFDFETDNDWEAQQWFDSYNGFDEDLVEGTDSGVTHLKLSGNMIEIPIDDNSEVGELGHPIQQGIGDPRRKKEVVSEATATLERPLSNLSGTLSSVLLAHKDEVDTLFDRSDAIEFLDRILPEVKSKAYVMRVKQDILKSRCNPVEYFYNIILKGDGDGTDKGGAVTKKSQVRKWARENLNEAMWEKGDSVTLWWKDPSWDKNTPCYASCTYIGRTRDGKYKFESDTYGWMYLLDLENKKITTPRGKVFDVWNDSGWLHENVETVVKYPNGMPVTEIDLESALDYMYGTDRDPEWTYTDAEMQKAVYYWMDKTDPRPDGKSYMNEDYKVQFYQVFKNPEKPTENGKMIAQAGTEDEAKAKGDKLVGKGNYFLKAVCDDGKVRDVDLHDYFNKSRDLDEDAERVKVAFSNDEETTAWNSASGSYVRLGAKDIDNDKLINSLKSQGYRLHRDTRFASGRDVTYVKESNAGKPEEERVSLKEEFSIQFAVDPDTEYSKSSAGTEYVTLGESDIYNRRLRKYLEDNGFTTTEKDDYVSTDGRRVLYRRSLNNESLTESADVYNVTFYMDSLDDNVMSGPHTTIKIYASSEDEAKQKLKDRCTDKYFIPTIVKIEKSVNEWYEFSDDDVEDDLMHAAVYGGDSKYCKVCGAVKEYDEDGFAFCPDCTKNESFDFDEDDEGKMVGVSFDVNAPSNMKNSEIEDIIRKAIAATDLDIPGYMEVHVLNEYLHEKLIGYKLTVKKNNETFDDYACAYEEEGAIRQMKNKYGDDIVIMKIDDSRVIRESLTESDKDQLKSFLTSLLDDNVFEHLDETDRKYAESQTRKFLAKLSNEKLAEASYGGVFDIEDDQYFMKDDLVDCAEKVIEHLNETFDDTFEIANLELQKPNKFVLEVEGNKLGWYMEDVVIDMRKIRIPSDLTNKYSFELASKLIAQIKSYNEMG